MLQYTVIHLPCAHERIENIITMEKTLSKPINVFEAHGPEPRETFQPGEVGCYKSHKALMESVSSTPGYTMIFEDDAVFPENLNAIIESVIHYFPEFDILFMGNLDSNRGTQVVENVFRLDPNRYCTGTQGYIVKNENTKTITSQLKFKRAIDLEITDLINEGKINGYVFWPPLVQQNRNLPSSIIR
jgi:GR25 family glycosyltransferase involved in LPS biosynthesis